MVARLLVTLLLLAACDGAVPVDTGGVDPATDAVDAEVVDPERDSEGDSAGRDSGNGGTGGDTSAPATLTHVGDRWIFLRDDTVLELDPTRGARVARFALGEVELLTDASVNPTNWGATFWTSPQSAWGWPPVAAIDTEPYTATTDGGTLVLTSGDAALGDTTISVEKRVSLGPSAVTLAYTVRNIGDTPVSTAGWEVARVPTGGLTFFRAGASVASTVGSFPYTKQGGVVWFDGAAPRSGDAKLVADGTGGWLAHVADRVLFLERFADLAPAEQAPGEGEIELFAASDYVELENQGALTTIAPGEGVTHTVRWSAVPLPEEVHAEVGNAALVAFVERTLSEARADGS